MRTSVALLLGYWDLTGCGRTRIYGLSREGHGFSRAVSGRRYVGALAPEGRNLSEEGLFPQPALELEMAVVICNELATAHHITAGSPGKVAPLLSPRTNFPHVLSIKPGKRSARPNCTVTRAAH